MDVVDFLEGVLGAVVGLGIIGAVFWFTFRAPPPRRSGDSTTAMTGTSDAIDLLRSGSDDGFTGHHG